MLDTWFSSALVPFTSLGWPEKTRDLELFLPSSVLVTGFDIIFFWVARMIMMTLHFTGKVPFRDVYINALVRDAEGEKMSKSKGNTLDPLDLIDGIALEALLAKSTTGLLRGEHKEKAHNYVRQHFPQGIPAFGTDAVRFTFASLATFARTLKFDLARCEGYRNFCNKLWNATPLRADELRGAATPAPTRALPVELTRRRPLDREPAPARRAGRARRRSSDYRFDMAAREIYELTWDEYCDWYVEIAKVAARRRHRSRAARHPAHADARAGGDPAARAPGDSVHHRGAVAESRPACRQERRLDHDPALPAGAGGEDRRSGGEPRLRRLKDLVNACRTLRSDMGIAPGQRVPLIVQGNRERIAPFAPWLAALARLSEVLITEHELPRADAPVSIVGGYKLMLKVEIDPAAERERLTKEKTRVEAESGEMRGQARQSRLRPARAAAHRGPGEGAARPFQGHAGAGRRAAAQAR